MADNVGYTPGTGAVVAADEIAGVLHQRVKLGIGADGVAVDLSAANPMPITTPTPIDVVTGGLTDAELRATPIDVVISGITEDAPLPVHDESAHQLLTRLLQYLNAPQGYDKSLQRARVTAVLESGTVTTVTTVTTVAAVTAVTSLNNYDGYNARMTVLDTNRTAWAQCVRARIT
jgi:hypothetical protein